MLEPTHIRVQRLMFLNGKGETIKEYLVAPGADLMVGDGIDSWMAYVRHVRLVNEWHPRERT